MKENLVSGTSLVDSTVLLWFRRDTSPPFFDSRGLLLVLIEQSVHLLDGTFTQEVRVSLEICGRLCHCKN